MDLRNLIHKKKEGKTLSPAEIHEFAEGVVQDQFPHYQISALLMAILFQGLSLPETVELTRAMACHGDRIPRTPGVRRVGKHSTGGVGDKTTFLLGPLVSSYKVEVPFMAGRGLGYTGGTIDKLSGLVGFKTSLDPAQIHRLLRYEGFCIFEQSKNIAPADRRLYALRDASATVESIPLIVSSILSKKILEGLDGLVLDVKFGGGSLMGSLRQARLLAKMLLAVAKALKLKATAVLSSMEQPLGQMIGNNLELIECLETLRGQGPADLVKLTVHLAREMLVLVLPKSKVPSKEQLQRRLTRGELVEPFFHYLRAQGARLKNEGNLKMPRHVRAIQAGRSGWIGRMDSRKLGQACMELGAGRQRLEEPIDPTVGMVLLNKMGDPVRRGEMIAQIFFNDKTHLHHVLNQVQEALRIDPRRKQGLCLIAGVVRNF